MVAGDLVNTASRIQSAAEPGTVLAGDATRRATEAAIIYEDAGEHALKGKSEPLQLHRAVRVIGGRGGALRSTGLEAPFVGRDRELRLLKELFHASAEEGTAHLLSVIGVAGIGKSRLSWEFFKYIDGLAATVYWHRGRCLAYGEGVTYWALAEMLRGAGRHRRGRDAAGRRSRSSARALEEHVPDPEERRWLEPRLAQLLGLEDRTAARARGPVRRARGCSSNASPSATRSVLVFEDMQWAEPALRRLHRLPPRLVAEPPAVRPGARPARGRRAPSRDGARTSATSTSLFLEPLPPSAMDSLLTGLVAPGLPPELRGRILDRAEGVPLYAVETVRMLIDRGLLVREGNEYRPTGEAPVEPRRARDAPRADRRAARRARPARAPASCRTPSVLGKTFTRRAAAAISGMSESELEPILSALVRKEVLSLQADPRSPERGQYGFLQDLVRRVAYETMPKRERKARHLAAADDLERRRGLRGVRRRRGRGRAPAGRARARAGRARTRRRSSTAPARR